MSNINPHPRFEPPPGKPTAAPRHFPYAHLSMEHVVAQREARTQERRDRMAGKCRFCKGRSPEWKIGRCTCGNTGLANPPSD